MSTVRLVCPRTIRFASWLIESRPAPSGGFGHRVQKSLALGYVDNLAAAATSGFEVELIGERRSAVRLAAPAFDPQGKRMRA
ncbi:MAG: hypothetical protein EXR87_04365 [Gammaproteobacteria bacterium]|nr:hypothetical protein [Gammaproteobacteria bacterium]